MHDVIVAVYGIKFAETFALMQQTQKLSINRNSEIRSSNNDSKLPEAQHAFA